LSAFSFTLIIHHANLAGWRKLAVVDDEIIAMTTFTIMPGGQTNCKYLSDAPGFAEIGWVHFAVRSAFTTMVL
jgi:hypothetical protein